MESNRPFRHMRFIVTALLTILIFTPVPVQAGGKDTKPKKKVKRKADLPPLPMAFTKVAPKSVEDLRDIQEHVRAVLERVGPAVVAVRIGAGQGSGVIIDKEGHVLTAAHVSGAPGRSVSIIMPDGRRLKGKSLGGNRRVDAGLVKITSKGEFPFVEMGESAQLKRGDWCLAIGHPGGYRNGRTPPVRLGRVLDNLSTLIRTDCTLVGGDSGGPLFDMNGRVIGIHSRIGPSIIYNIHVPVNHYRKDWERLVKSEVFPAQQKKATAYLGVQGDTEAKSCRITKVHPNTPAAKGGIKENDIITEFDGKKIENFQDLVAEVGRSRAGRYVDIVLERDGETVKLIVKLGKAK